VPLPDWYTPGDPYAGRRMRQLLAIGQGEQQIRAAVDQAIEAFLAIARAGVLGEPTPAPLVAAVNNDDVPPNVDGGWPSLEQWAALLRQFVIPAISVMFGEQFYAETRRALLSITPYVNRHIEQVFDRLVIWPADAFNDVRAELQEGLTTGDSIAQLRSRIGRVLDIDAPSRALAADIAVLTRTIEDDETPKGVRREARARRAALYRRQDDADRLWQWKAARIARTEALGAFNAGTYMGAAAYELATGETRYKQWWSTSDDRVRASHWAAHMQVAELHNDFMVGGFRLDHPGDPTAPGHEVINCRCTILVLTAAQAVKERARYEQLRPGRTNRNGELIDDEGNPIGPAPTVDGLVPMIADATTRGNDMPKPLLADAGDPTTDTDTTPTELPIGWRGILAPLDTRSGDGRIIAATEALRVRPLPIAFKWQDMSTFGHDGAVIIGAITKVWQDAGNLWGSGPLDLADVDGAEIARKMRDGFAGHVSVDLDDVTAEWRVFDPDGKLVPEDDVQGLLVPDAMDPDWLVLPEGYSEGEIATDWRLMSTTVVADPAFPEARVFAVYDAAEIVPATDLIAEREAEANAAATTADVALVAGAAPIAAPLSWFERPQLDGPTPLTITDDGRVFGHAALFDSCHVGYAGRCVPAPKGADYGRFHLKAYRTVDGGDIAVGALVMGTDHASTSRQTTVAMAMAHYANNGKCAAYVRAGDDEYGVWVSGVLDPGLTDTEQVRARAMTLSGDWRTIDGRVAFIAALAVNVPGFAVPRRTTGAEGQLVSLVAAGAIYRAPDVAGQRRTASRQANGGSVRVVVPPAREFAREVLREMASQQAEQAQADQLTRRVREGAVAVLASRVHKPDAAAVAALAARVNSGRG
jgi:hypothetical protein